MEHEGNDGSWSNPLAHVSQASTERLGFAARQVSVPTIASVVVLKA